MFLLWACENSMHVQLEYTWKEQLNYYESWKCAISRFSFLFSSKYCMTTYVISRQNEDKDVETCAHAHTPVIHMYSHKNALKNNCFNFTFGKIGSLTCIINIKVCVGSFFCAPMFFSSFLIHFCEHISRCRWK